MTAPPPPANAHSHTIHAAPIASFERRRQYEIWKRARPAAESYTTPGHHPATDAETEDSLKAPAGRTLSDSIQTATIYKYLYSTSSLVSLFAGVFSVMQSRRNRWFLFASPLLLGNAYLSYAKFEETLDDIEYLEKRKEMRAQCPAAPAEFSSVHRLALPGDDCEGANHLIRVFYLVNSPQSVIIRITNDGNRQHGGMLTTCTASMGCSGGANAVASVLVDESSGMGDSEISYGLSKAVSTRFGCAVVLLYGLSGFPGVLTYRLTGQGAGERNAVKRQVLLVTVLTRMIFYDLDGILSRGSS